MNINLHIERLVLDGVNITTGQRHLLQACVTNELINLLNNGGLASNLVEGRALSRLPTRRIQVTDNQTKQFGQQIAQSVYGGIGRE